MEGSSGRGPVSARVRANLRRIRQERGFTYAELTRRLCAAGYQVADTMPLKTEQSDRRITADDIAAFAVVLGCSPNSLLLPAEDDGTPHQITPAVSGTHHELWAWATGEAPLGSKPATATTGRDARSAEVVFNRENRPHHWGPASSPGVRERGVAAAQAVASAGIAAFVLEAFRAGLSTADIRDAVEGSLAAALVTADPSSLSIRIESSEGQITIWTGPGDEDREAAS